MQTWHVGRWNFAVDMNNGYVMSLTDQVTGTCVLRNVMPCLVFTVNGRTINNTGCWHKVEGTDRVGTKPTLRAVNVNHAATGAELTLNYAEGNWEWFVTFHMDPNTSGIQCSFGITLTSGEPQILRDATFEWVQPVTDVEKAHYTEPGYPPQSGIPIQTQRLWSSLPLGRCGSSSVNQLRDSPAFYPGVFVLWDGTAHMNWASWWYSPSIPATAECEKRQGELVRRYRFHCPSRMHAGKTLTFDTFYFSGSPALEPATPVNLQSYWGEAGIGVESSRNDLVNSLAIYEVYVGEKAGRVVYPALEDITADLARIRDLGFNAIQIMPRMPMPAYSGVINYYDPAFNFGGDLELQRLVRTAHELGIRVILDIVLHGSPTLDDEPGLRKWQGPPSIYRTVHSDWLMRNEDGRVTHAHNDSFDLANPDWQDHVAGAFFWYVAGYGIDGFRIDAQNWNFFPNWDPRIAPREAHGNFYGAYGLISKVRARLKEVGKDAFIYTEWGGPINYGLYDATYNYDESWIPAALCPVLDPRGEASYDPGWAETLTWPELAAWLQHRKAVFPPYAPKIHHLDSHDTHEWKGLNQFRHEAFGNAAAKALFALMAWLDGGILVFTGAETANAEYYKWVLTQRAAMRNGECHYIGALCPSHPKVATLLWTSGKDAASAASVVVINLSDAAVSTDLAVKAHTSGLQLQRYKCAWQVAPDGAAKAAFTCPPVVEANQEGVLSIPVDIPAYGVGVLELLP